MTPIPPKIQDLARQRALRLRDEAIAAFALSLRHWFSDNVLARRRVAPKAAPAPCRS